MTANVDSVVVTGALGGAGRWVVDRLVKEGYDVVGLDRQLPEGDVPTGASFFAVDLTDGGETAERVADADPDAVVHLAAIPDPLNHAGSRGRSSGDHADGVAATRNARCRPPTLEASGGVRWSPFGSTVSVRYDRRLPTDRVSRRRGAARSRSSSRSRYR